MAKPPGPPKKAMNNYCVIHIEKQSGPTGALGRHIDRRIQPKNANPEKANLNFAITTREINGRNSVVACRPDEQAPLIDRVNDRIREGYKGKKALRKDAIKQLNVILTGSHDAMTAMDEGQISEWALNNYIFLADKYGRENVVGFVVHLDERTPHIHATIVPLTEDGRLSAKEVVGNNKQLAALQDEYAEAMKQFDLVRGRRYSQASHLTTAEYYRVVEATEESLSPLLSDEQLPEPPQVTTPPLNPLKHDEWRKQQQAELDDYAQKVNQAFSRQRRNIELTKAKARRMFEPILDWMRLRRKETRKKFQTHQVSPKSEKSLKTPKIGQKI